ncbi:MAG: aldehyde dehydrogenase family protein [Pseudomonadota bacterium]
MKPLLIGGAWRDGGHALPNVNPSDLSDTIDHYAQAGVQECQEAVEAAAAAAPIWARVSPLMRSDLLRLAGDEVMARREELGEFLSREEGKIRREGVAEATRAAQILHFFSGEALRLSGDRLASTRPGVELETPREPVGDVGIIAPWNFPLAIPTWKIAPALAFGNAVVFKPAEYVPGCAWALVDILQRAAVAVGAPEGVLNLVMGPGAVVGQALVDDRAVDAITFTGSVATGARIGAACMARMAKVQLEMGGKNPLVVLDDADLDAAVACAVDGAFFSTGQRCTASSRLIVTEGVYSRFVEQIAERARALRVDHALKPEAEIGPVAAESELEKDLDWVARARSEGGALRAGGERLRRETDGYFMAPALIADTTSDMAINQEEVFGPVATVIRARDYEEALHIANDTPFGLSAGICTTSLKHASHFKRNAVAGMVMVNLPTAGVDPHAPFGGRKASSYGPREQGGAALEFFTHLKTAYTQP